MKIMEAVRGDITKLAVDAIVNAVDVTVLPSWCCSSILKYVIPAEAQRRAGTHMWTALGLQEVSGELDRSLAIICPVW